MDTYDLETAFWKKLDDLSFEGKTLKPDEEVSDKDLMSWRRGVVRLNRPETVGFGNGIYSRNHSLYQIEIQIPRQTKNALKLVKKASDAHRNHFFPVNGRGQTLTEKQTSAHIDRLPNQISFGREGAYLREIVEVYFYVEIPAAG